MVKVSTLLFQLVKSIWWVKLKSRIRVVNNTVFFISYEICIKQQLKQLIGFCWTAYQLTSLSVSHPVTVFHHTESRVVFWEVHLFYVASIILHCHSNCGYIHTCHFLKKLFDTICGRSLTSCSNSFYHVKNTLTSVHFISSEYVNFH